MSVAATGASGVPIVNQALEPSWVRDGSAATKQAYDSALAFEQTFVEQLSQTLAKDTGLEEGSGGEGASGGEAGTASEGAGSTQGSPAGDSELSMLLPQALTTSIMSAGGLGMAAQLTRELEGVTGSADTGATTATTAVSAGGGAAAPAGGAR